MTAIQRAKALRVRTGAPILECVLALYECSDDEQRAVEWLRRRVRCRAAGG